ncbi:AraC family transcriptional regulator [Trinickia dabaoshanensis]|uniref:AraC family transcriptional regulator n=1 Tax=Trinickia dabaoshanensis TaxID=564714 RepID=A0A2N7VMV9_9BURK|nr:AraC family transcriptional regulator [Trinickia dabaoshanensis]PMS18511.1 AraC family transcriptional regulator [Trinickia dabaoshanensis]
MVDPLSEVVTLLQPRASVSKVVNGSGRWRVRRYRAPEPLYFVIVEGMCTLTVDERAPIELQADDFVLIPSSSSLTMTSLEPPLSDDLNSPPTVLPNGELSLGTEGASPDVRYLVGHCIFGSPDAALLISLLPRFVHIRGERRLTTLVQLVVDEFRSARPARDVVLGRLLDVLFIEAFRSSTGAALSPGLLRGLGDDRLAAAIRAMHASPTHAWTVAQLAKQAALSRSSFFDRFTRAVGMAPMEYLHAWRMAMAKKMLLHNEGSVAEVAERVGYGSASAFSVAFARFVGLPPSQYAQARMATEQ